MANLLLDPNLWRLVSLSGSPPAAWDGECYGESASRFLALRTTVFSNLSAIQPGDVVAGSVNYEPAPLSNVDGEPHLAVGWVDNTGQMQQPVALIPVNNGDTFSVEIDIGAAPFETYLAVFLTMAPLGETWPEDAPYSDFETPVGSLICPTAPAVDVCYPPQCGCSLPAC